MADGKREMDRRRSGGPDRDYRLLRGLFQGLYQVELGRADLDGRLRAVFRAGKEISRFQSRPENGIDE